MGQAAECVLRSPEAGADGWSGRRETAPLDASPGGESHWVQQAVRSLLPQDPFPLHRLSRESRWWKELQQARGAVRSRWQVGDDPRGNAQRGEFPPDPGEQKWPRRSGACMFLGPASSRREVESGFAWCMSSKNYRFANAGKL